VVRGNGSHIWDIDGREYIDYYLGSASLVLGHSHPDVTAAVRRQLELGTQFFELTPSSIELANLIAQVVPCAEGIKYANSGSEATAIALRVARAYTGRDKILKFEGAYHGTHDWALWACRHHEPFDYPYAEPDSLGIPSELGKYVLVAPYNDLESAAAIIDQHKNELGAVIAEPLLGNIRPKPGFLAGLREITRDHGIPLIFDEVVSGFRLALGGAQEYYGVIPDMAALGKSLGGGFPIGAIVGRAELMDLLRPSSTRGFAMYVGTFSGNPISCAAAVATIRCLQRPGTYERLRYIARQLADGLRSISDRLRVPTFVVNEGPMVDIWFTDHAIESYRDTWTADRVRGNRFKVGLMKRGIWSPPGYKLFMSFAHTNEDINRTLQAAEDSMRVL